MPTRPATSPLKALSEKSPNTSSPSKIQKELDHQQAEGMVKPKAFDTKTTQDHVYISPSDNILSPTSKKLSEIKGKRFANAKSRSLFAKTVSREGLKSQEKLQQAEKKEQVV